MNLEETNEFREDMRKRRAADAETNARESWGDVVAERNEDHRNRQQLLQAETASSIASKQFAEQSIEDSPRLPERRRWLAAEIAAKLEPRVDPTTLLLIAEAIVGWLATGKIPETGMVALGERGRIGRCRRCGTDAASGIHTAGAPGYHEWR